MIVDLSGTVQEVRPLKGQIRHFSLPHPDLMPSLEVTVSEFSDKPYHPTTRMMGLSDGVDSVILA